MTIFGDWGVLWFLFLLWWDGHDIDDIELNERGIS